MNEFIANLYGIATILHLFLVFLLIRKLRVFGYVSSLVDTVLIKMDEVQKTTKKAINNTITKEDTTQFLDLAGKLHKDNVSVINSQNAKGEGSAESGIMETARNVIGLISDSLPLVKQGIKLITGGDKDGEMP